MEEEWLSGASGFHAAGLPLQVWEEAQSLMNLSWGGGVGFLPQDSK